MTTTHHPLLSLKTRLIYFNSLANSQEFALAKILHGNVRSHFFRMNIFKFYQRGFSEFLGEMLVKIYFLCNVSEILLSEIFISIL